MAGIRKWPPILSTVDYNAIIDYLGGESTNPQIIAAKMLTRLGGVPLSNLLNVDKLKGSEIDAINAALITEGILAAARGGHGKTVDLTGLGNLDLLQFDQTNDKFVPVSELALRNALMLQGVDVQEHQPEDGEYLKYSAANKRWEPASM